MFPPNPCLVNQLKKAVSLYTAITQYVSSRSSVAVLTLLKVASRFRTLNPSKPHLHSLWNQNLLLIAATHMAAAIAILGHSYAVFALIV